MRRTAARSVPALAAVALVVAGGVAVARAGLQEEPFPHEEHAGLFPLCTGCHLGVPDGDRGRFYPDPGSCANCHDGEELERVEWSAPGHTVTNLRFSHPEHAGDVAAADGAGLDCESCHGREGTPRMRVMEVEAEPCLSCHAHEAESHLANAACADCHVPLAETRLDRGRIAALPVPESHERDDFLLRAHGRSAETTIGSCTVCHTRESCTSCHVDAAGVEAIGALARAPTSLELPDYEARYPVPPSHRREGFLEGHGRRLEVSECSACHTRESCTSCHVEPAPEPIARLVSREAATAPGVEPERSAPPSHDGPYFRVDHGALASASPGSCTTCHAESRCVDCHEAPREASFHPPNFVLRHSTAAYGRQLECSSCHDVEAFCQSCHLQRGTGAAGRLGPGFHDGQRLWLLRHGQPARQSLESCVSCHTQSDCLQCHSTTGAFQVSPHGPGFDPERVADRNRAVCFACHVRDPLQGGSP